MAEKFEVDARSEEQSGHSSKNVNGQPLLNEVPTGYMSGVRPHLRKILHLLQADSGKVPCLEVPSDSSLSI